MINFIQSVRTKLALRRAYRAAIVEIEQLDARELSDMGVDRETLASGVYRQVYGTAR